MGRDSRDTAPRSRPEVAPTAVPAGRAADDVVQQTTNVITPRDRVRWGPIWAGLITAFVTFLVLQLLMYGLGLLTLDFNLSGMDAPGTGGNPWVTAIIALLSFLLGGFVAGSTAVTRSPSAGLLNGFLVWALGVTLMLTFSVLGLGQLFGALGDVAGRFLSAQGPLGPNDLGRINLNPEQLADALRTAALIAFATVIAMAGAAAGGGLLGASAAGQAGDDRAA